MPSRHIEGCAHAHSVKLVFIPCRRNSVAVLWHMCVYTHGSSIDPCACGKCHTLTWCGLVMPLGTVVKRIRYVHVFRVGCVSVYLKPWYVHERTLQLYHGFVRFLVVAVAVFSHTNITFYHGACLSFQCCELDAILACAVPANTMVVEPLAGAHSCSGGTRDCTMVSSETVPWYGNYSAECTRSIV